MMRHTNYSLTRFTAVAVPLALRAIVAAHLLWGATAVAARSQDEPASSPPAGIDQDEPLQTPVAASELLIKRVHLLREGSYVIDAQGRLEPDAADLLWTFTPTAAASDRAMSNAELILLPCSLLAETQRLARSLQERGVIFELTGQVTAYKGRNFLLLTSAPRLVGYEATTAARQEDQPDPGAGDAGGDGAGAQSADEAEQQLQRALSGLGQAAAAGAPDPETRSDADRAAAEASAQDSQSEGTILASRRGTIARDAGGAWVFSFDADAEGVADPPLVLLPCLQLERIESYARLMGAHAPVLLSGRVHRYEGRGYILPTAFSIPAEHSRITP